MTAAAGRFLILGFFSILALAPDHAEARRPGPAGTVEQLLGLHVAPVAVAHRGFGDNLGEDPTRPIENTIAAVRRGFTAGASVVEVDVQLTRDGEVAVYHDDFLPDLTCLNQLTLAELQARLPYVPSLQAVLNQARQFNQSAGPLMGLVIVELKAAAPLCDPDDVAEPAIVSTVVRVIRQMNMGPQTLLTSLSPTLLYRAAGEAPEIARILSVSGVQFLTQTEIEALLGLPVVPIVKHPDLGLQWGEIGSVYRLPGYRSIGELVTTAVIVGAQVVEADLFLLSSTGAALVDGLHALGFKVLGFTATTEAEWHVLESLGVDGIYTNDVPLGVSLQAPIP
jgi:glycerophosphoryl diester phosphodiesterase